MSEETGGRRAFTRVAEEKVPRKVSDTVIIKRLLHYLRPYRTKIFAFLIISSIHGFIDLSEPIMHLIVIDEIILPMNFNGFYWWVPLFFGILVAHYFIHRTQMILISDIGNNITAELRTDLTTHIQNISLRYFSEGETGRVMSRVTNDVEVLTQFLAWRGLPTLVLALTGMFGIIIILSVLNWRLLLATLAVSFLSVGLLSALGVFSRRAHRIVRAKMGGLTSNLQENISGMKVVKSFQREAEILNSFDRANNEYSNANLKAARISSMMEPAVDWVRGVTVATIIFYGSILIYGGQLTIGEIVAFMEFTVFERIYLTMIARAYDLYTSSMAASERIFALQDTTPEVRELPKESRIELPPSKGEIKFENVTFGYDPKDSVIRNVSFNLNFCGL